MQHKQIRPQDQHYDQRGMGPGGSYGGDPYGIHQGGGRGGYVGGRGMNLPPSGPMAVGWYNNRQGGHHHHDPHGNGDPGMGGIGMSHSYEDGNGAPSPPSGDGQVAGAGPLSSMEPLRQTLPDVGGAPTSGGTGEN